MIKRGLTRSRLVAIAQEFVSEHGLDALTMRRLAAAAEVTPGALYKHVRDRRDLKRAMADAVFGEVDLSGIETDRPSVDQVVECFVRMRRALLKFRDGGRMVAGSYSPSVQTLRVASTVMALLHAVTPHAKDAGDVALILRSYVTGFVIEEQAYLDLLASGEWDGLVDSILASGVKRDSDASDVIAVMTDDRDERFVKGLRMILTGLVRDTPGL